MSNNIGIGPALGIIGGGCVAVVALVLAVAALWAWPIMLIQGGLSSTFDWETWSYGTSFLVSLGLSVIGSFFKNVSK